MIFTFVWKDSGDLSNDANKREGSGVYSQFDNPDKTHDFGQERYALL